MTGRITLDLHSMQRTIHIALPLSVIIIIAFRANLGLGRISGSQMQKLWDRIFISSTESQPDYKWQPWEGVIFSYKSALSVLLQ